MCRGPEPPRTRNNRVLISDPTQMSLSGASSLPLLCRFAQTEIDPFCFASMACVTRAGRQGRPKGTQGVGRHCTYEDSNANHHKRTEDRRVTSANHSLASLLCCTSLHISIHAQIYTIHLGKRRRCTTPRAPRSRCSASATAQARAVRQRAAPPAAGHRPEVVREDGRGIVLAEGARLCGGGPAARALLHDCRF